MKPTILLMVAILFASCSTKKSTYEFKEHIKYDSINYQSQMVIYPTIKETIYVDSPCDSLGQLKPFKQSFITSQGKIIIEGKNNRITTDIDLKETSSTETKEAKTSTENVTKKREELKRIVVQDWRLILALILSIILNLYFIASKLKLI